MVMQSENKKLEQYRRKFCFRLVVVSSNNQETREAVLEKFHLRIKEAHCHVLDLE